MALTRNFKETVLARVRADPKFRDALLKEGVETMLPEHRERLYPPTVTLSMFMRQTLESDGSCQKAVNGWAA